MSNRPKISSLSEKELAQLLIDSFFMIGKDLKLNISTSKVLLVEVYKYHGWIYVDSFTEAFSKYAADELPDADSLKPTVSPRFISKLMKFYFKKLRESHTLKKEGNDTSSTFTPEEKYMLFIRFIKDNRSLPGNCDWVTIFEFLTSQNKLLLPTDWAKLTFYGKLKHATQEVTCWAHNNFSISDTPLYLNAAGTPLKGIGSRLGESLWAFNQ